jgi:Adenylate and Guanylate cyclase catalytic domain
MSLATGPSLIHANFFFIDIVGLSDPSMSTKIQIKKIKTLNKSIMNCSTFRSTSKDTMLVLPAGDGMAIGFLQGPELPLKLAIELHEKVAKYNKGKIPHETVRIRIGIHSGPVFIVDDIFSNKNIWGPGIIIARRIMDIGDDGHILLSARTAEDLREISDQYKQIIKPLHNYSIKHGQVLSLYSSYGKGFGNPRPPSKGSSQHPSKINKEMGIERKIITTLYPRIEVHITIKDPKTMLVHYKRLYEIQSISDEPIYEVVHGIATDVEKTFDDLNIRVYDENNKLLQISDVAIDKPYQKEFTTIFNRPILKSEKGRYYVLEYDVEELDRYFENYFAVDCHTFVVTIDYPKDMTTPVVYDVNLENDEVKRYKVQPVVEKGRANKRNRNLARWTKRDIIQGQSFKFEW